MNRKIKTLMIQGTSSGVGKSLFTTGLCRIFSQDGFFTTPFKAINISLNSGVTGNGKEIARSQIIQAVASGIKPEALMNPILIKPQTNLPPQVIRLGKVSKKNNFWSVIKSSFDKLSKRFNLIVIEGAGSPAEPNFIRGDMANLQIAKYAKSPVIMVGDIDKGGVFASLEGTIAILRRHDPEALALIKGFIINKYQGEKAALAPAILELTKITGIPVLGVVPFIPNHGIEDEDTWGLTDRVFKKPKALLDVVIIRIPTLANSPDFDPLILHPNLVVRFISASRNFGNPDLVILPGSKNTLADLAWLRSSGLADQILIFARLGKAVIGICGGFQMLGKSIADPNFIESSQSEVSGLGLLNLETTFKSSKVTKQTTLKINGDSGILKGAKSLFVSGYEIHQGQTTKTGKRIKFDSLGWVFGSYLHDIFKNEQFTNLVLKNIAGKRKVTLPKTHLVDPESHFINLADIIRANIDLKLLYQILNKK